MSVARADIMLVSYEIEEFEAAFKSLIEMPSWHDWWMVTVVGLAISSQPEDVTKVHCLFMAGEESD